MGCGTEVLLCFSRTSNDCWALKRTRRCMGAFWTRVVQKRVLIHNHVPCIAVPAISLAPSESIHLLIRHIVSRGSIPTCRALCSRFIPTVENTTPEAGTQAPHHHHGAVAGDTSSVLAVLDENLLAIQRSYLNGRSILVPLRSFDERAARTHQRASGG